MMDQTIMTRYYEKCTNLVLKIQCTLGNITDKTFTKNKKLSTYSYRVISINVFNGNINWSTF